MGLFNNPSKADQIKSLSEEVATLRSRAGRRDYAINRTDSWVDVLPTGIADVLGTELNGFNPGRWSSTGALGDDVAQVVVTALPSPTIVFSALQHAETVPDLTIQMDSNPGVDDLAAMHLVQIEAWWRRALTGEVFDARAAAAQLNSL